MVRVHPGPPERGAIAQPGEHRLCKPGVGGSNPPGSTTPPGPERNPRPSSKGRTCGVESSDGFSVSARAEVARELVSRRPCSLTTWKVRSNSARAIARGKQVRTARDPTASCWMPSTGVRVRGSSEQAHTVDALATTGDERRDSLRKAPGSWQSSPDPEISEWGNPPARVFRPESIGSEGEPGELKHLSTRRNRNQPRFRQ